MASSAAVSAASPPHVRRRLCPLLPQAHLSRSPKPNAFLLRRSFLLSSSSSAAAASLLLFPQPGAADTDAPAPAPAPPPAQTQSGIVTDRVFMDFGLCPSYLASDRPLGFDLAACPDSEPLGRVVFGLYGKLLPQTVANFKAVCAAAAYRGTLVHKILQGQFFVAGRQGRKEKGVVRPPPGLVRNVETVDPKAFQLRHSRPGTLSLCLAENDDDDAVKLEPEYHNVEFLVTTGPGPCPQLDNENIVFGTVLEAEHLVGLVTLPERGREKPILFAVGSGENKPSVFSRDCRLELVRGRLVVC
ncbi:hypothetical protein B296_00042542 [Ensete ventricosum]|uniref:PPIase cyclophilin-type domain-containing protein n=1 Tax=Ensete ventricosum TaxID=4639 RepID=A0A426YDE8_ENSVE|nr:hypothetical protein B296_00042542 [Ensete ventricosum]